MGDGGRAWCELKPWAATGAMSFFSHSGYCFQVSGETWQRGPRCPHTLLEKGQVLEVAGAVLARGERGVAGCLRRSPLGEGVAGRPEWCRPGGQAWIFLLIFLMDFRERNSTPMCWFISQMPLPQGFGQASARSQEFHLRHGWQECGASSCPCCLAGCLFAGSWSRERKPQVPCCRRRASSPPPPVLTPRWYSFFLLFGVLSYSFSAL